MDESKHSRSISLQCSTCGGEEYEHDNTEIIKCVRCGRLLTKDELQAENSRKIEAEIAEVKREILKDFEKEISKVFKKWK